MFQDGSVKTILTGSHKAPSGRTSTDTPRLNCKQPQVWKASVVAPPHPASQRRTSNRFPLGRSFAFDVLHPAMVRPPSQCLAVEFISTASSSTVSGLLTLFPKCFSSFLHSTCSLSVSHIYLVLEEVYLPLRAAISNNPTLWIPSR